MPRRDGRQAISVKGVTHQRLRDYCDATGQSMSGFLEDLIAEKMDAAGVPVPTVLKARATKKAGRRSKAEIEEIASQHFTF